MIGSVHLPSLIQLLEEALGDPDRVPNAEQKMRVITQRHIEFSQYHAEFQVITANLDWNP